MILLMVEEIKAVAMLAPGVPSFSKFVSVQSSSPRCTGRYRNYFITFL
jgi:hypothetical protein